MPPAATLLLLAALTAGPGRPATPAEADFFERGVRPLLVRRCVSCHGPDRQRGGLRLDGADGLRKGGTNGPVARADDPAQSPLRRAVRHDGPLKMPPTAPLPDAEVAVLDAWLAMGAPWPATVGAPQAEAWRRHWAFRPVRRPEPPAVKAAAWPQNDLDRFVLAKLEEKGLAPSPPATRRALLRRATFDLTGLPPTPDEVEAFVADAAADAWERAVERLLASPAYGERWARHWLDVARYADTRGYVFFQEHRFPWAWTYRDYVVRAFNDDLPYDRFVVEQLAADRLPPAGDNRALAALGFLTLGGRFMNNPHDVIDDRIDVVTRGLLGLTVSCARCHDHKFDPVPTADYYALHGVFASCREPEVPPALGAEPASLLYAGFRHELGARARKLDDFLEGKWRALAEGGRRRAAEYLLAAQALHGRPATADFMLLADGNDLNPALTARWAAYLDRTRRSPHPVWGLWHALAALPDVDFAARAAALIDGKCNPRLAAAFRARPPATLADAARLYGEVLNAADARRDRDLARTAASGEPPPPPVAADAELLAVFYGPDAPPDVPRGLFSELELLPDRAAQGVLQQLRGPVEKWRADGPGAVPRAHVLVDLPTPYEPRVFVRGNPATPGEAVPRRFLAALSGDRREPFRDGSGRLELARAVASRDNPLTARVLVNRVWQHHFGEGLVRTPSDFGLRCEPPSHPELLDHLAWSFVEQGWSVKKLHRLILLSATYRQSSADRADGRRLDPEDVLLWRFPRRRLDFEQTRDALLFVAGRLDRTVGGPPVPDALAPTATRRTLYAHLDRLQVPGLWRTFDFPSPDASSPRRDGTTVPQQGLFLMNHPLAHESVRGVLRRPEVAAEKDAARRIDRLHLLLYGRPATAEDVALGQEYLGGAPDEGRWQRYVHALLLTNEFVFTD